MTSDSITENSPLIEEEESPGVRSPEDTTFDEIEKLPSRKRPSIFKVLPIYAFSQISSFMLKAVQMNWVITLVCRNHYSQKLSDGDPKCQQSDIQSLVSSYTALCSLVSGVLGLYMLPRISKWSDKVGRRLVFGIYFLGDIAGLISMIILLKFWDYIDYRVLILPYLFTGICGTNVVITIMMSSYTSDCVRPTQRPKAMSYVTACQLIGKCVGPFLSSQLVQKTGGTISSTLYGALVFDGLALLYLRFRVPESKHIASLPSSEADFLNSAHQPPDRLSIMRQSIKVFNILEPLKKIRQVCREAESRAIARNILALLSVDLIYEIIINGRAGIAVLYPQMKFGWTSVELGYLEAATAIARIFLLVIIIPYVIKFLRKLFQEPEDITGITKTEVSIVGFGNALEVVGYTGYGLAVNTTEYILSSFIATSGVVAKPFVQSGLLNLVPQQHIATFLGAKGVLDGLFGIGFSTIGLWIYSYTVSRKPELLFYMSAAGYAIVIVIIFATVRASS